MEETRPNGVERADVIDFFAHDTKTDEVLLVRENLARRALSARQKFECIC